jgi:antitoxin CcdA
MRTSPPRRDGPHSLPQATEHTASSIPTLAAVNAAESLASEVNVSPGSAMKDEIALAHTRRRRWLSENEAALRSSNEFAERNGLPLAKYRHF